MRRAAMVILLAASLACVENAQPVMSFSSSGAMKLSMSPDQPSEAAGGVRMRYEQVRLECERLTYRMAALAGTPKPVLSTADLIGGPDGRVLFDSTNSQMPQIAFRGLLRPRTLAIRRLDADPAKPTEVRFRGEASDLGDVVGVVNTAKGLRQHVAWADRAVLEFVGTVQAGGPLGIDTPRMTALHLYGRPADGTTPAKPAVVLRLVTMVPVEQAVVDTLIAANTYGMRASGMTMSLYFGADGALSGYQSDTGDYEMRDGDDLIPHLGGSKPTLGK